MLYYQVYLKKHTMLCHWSHGYGVTQCSSCRDSSWLAPLHRHILAYLHSTMCSVSGHTYGCTIVIPRLLTIARSAVVAYPRSLAQHSHAFHQPVALQHLHPRPTELAEKLPTSVVIEEDAGAGLGGRKRGRRRRWLSAGQEKEEEGGKEVGGWRGGIMHGLKQTITQAGSGTEHGR